MLYKYLKNEGKKYILSKEVLRSGTNVGVNVEVEESKKDFKDNIINIISKIVIT